MKYQSFSHHPACVELCILQSLFLILVGINLNSKLLCQLLRCGCMIKMPMSQKNGNGLIPVLTDTLCKLLCHCPRINNDHLLCLIIYYKIAVGLHRTNYIHIYL